VNGLTKCLRAVSICVCVLVTATWAGETSSHQSCSSSSTKNQDRPDVVKRLDAAATVLDEIMGTPDQAIPRNVLADAKCIAVIPSMVNIAVGFGGRRMGSAKPLPIPTIE
jgi:lipid-binding SYLF domain-containing protein